MRIKLTSRTASLLLIKILFVSLLFIAFLSVIQQHKQTDLIIYYDYSLNLLKGQFPYVDFNFEYPPLALLPLTLPQLPSIFHPLSLRKYVILFFIQNAILSYFIAVLISRITAICQSKKQVVETIVLFAILIAINLTTVFCRYDIFSALLTLLAFWSVLRQRPTQAGIWLGLGIAAKLYPIVVVPIFLIYYLTKRQYQALVKVCLGTALTVNAIFIPFALATQDKFFSFLTYHKLRGLHLETLPGGILLLLHRFKMIDASFELNYGAFHFTSAIALPILKILPILTWILLGIVLVCCLKAFRREYAATGEITYTSLATHITLTLLVFIITAKVFSPQYLVWLLPFLPLLRLSWVSLTLIVAISITTLLEYPLLFVQLLNLHLIPILVLNLRNILVVALTAYLLTNEFRKLRQKESAT